MFEADRFFAGATGDVSVETNRYHLTVVDVGELNIRSGQVEASDPFVNLGNALIVDVPPGSYPVRVTVADVSDELDGSHLREAYLSLLVADGEVARVENALPAGAAAPEDGTFYGVGVDAGTVAFADAAAVRAGMPTTDWYSTVFDTGTSDGWFQKMDDSDHYCAGVANVPLPVATQGENLVLCHSGWGDGFYPVVKTYDADGRLLGVHIDLLVVEGDEAE
jgi:hypothetical protein